MDNNNNNANKKPNKVNMPKFNLNWLYMIIAMMLLACTSPMKTVLESKVSLMTNSSNTYVTAI